MKRVFVFMGICLFLCSCSLVHAEVKEGVQGVIENKDGDVTGIQDKIEQFKEVAKQFKEGDSVVYILRVTFDDSIPVIFYPDNCPIGKVLSITDDGFIVVQWENKNITSSNPFFLAKFNKKK